MKVANLVKAYVDKYKHMRKHLKPGGEEAGGEEVGGEEAQNAEDGKDSESP